MGGVTPPPDPGRAVAEARDRAFYMMDELVPYSLAMGALDTLIAAVEAATRARLLSGQQDADAHGEALRRHQAGA